MKVRHAITAVALTASTLLGAATMAAPAGAAVAPQTAQDGAVQQFWQYMYGLETTHAQCVAIRQSASGIPHQVVYGGSCLQSFAVALYSGGSIAWEYDTAMTPPAPVLYGYYVDEGTPDAPQFVLIYTGTQSQTDASAAANPETGCSAPVSDGC